VSDLAVQAARQALVASQLEPKDIDMILVATSTADMLFPSTACIVQSKLGLDQCAALDVQAACTGFIYGLTMADAMIRCGSMKRILVIGAEAFSRLVDFSDRTTCVLFGDGAGAVVVEASETAGILASDIHANGQMGDVLCLNARIQNGVLEGNPYVAMAGKEVFKLAVELCEKTARTVLEKAKMSSEDVDWLVPHQANVRIIRGAARKLGLSIEKVMLTLDHHGNTSAASIPLALDEGIRSGRIKSGQLALLEGVGAGFTWGSVLLRV
jgi:3-oxoacyl-[acyl-carrier-protein] synthase-3